MRVRISLPVSPGPVQAISRSALAGGHRVQTVGDLVEAELAFGCLCDGGLDGPAWAG